MHGRQAAWVSLSKVGNEPEVLHYHAHPGELGPAAWAVRPQSLRFSHQAFTDGASHVTATGACRLSSHPLFQKERKSTQRRQSQRDTSSSLRPGEIVTPSTKASPLQDTEKALGNFQR